MNWYVEVLKKYAVFEGRARRQEYWMFCLVNFLVSFALGMLSAVMGVLAVVLCWIYGLAVIVPSVAVTVRRLHDTARSGWWALITFVPLIGWIVLLVFLIQEGTPGMNPYGPDPKAGA